MQPYLVGTRNSNRRHADERQQPKVQMVDVEVADARNADDLELVGEAHGARRQRVDLRPRCSGTSCI
jgi:hypothetical protein